MAYVLYVGLPRIRVTLQRYPPIDREITKSGRVLDELLQFVLHSSYLYISSAYSYNRSIEKQKNSVMAKTDNGSDHARRHCAV